MIYAKFHCDAKIICSVSKQNLFVYLQNNKSPHHNETLYKPS